MQAREYTQAAVDVPAFDILPIYGGLSAEKQMKVRRWHRVGGRGEQRRASLCKRRESVLQERDKDGSRVKEE